jgi:hypothetical protein
MQGFVAALQQSAYHGPCSHYQTEVFGKAVRFALKDAVPGAVVVSRVLFGASEAGDGHETALWKVANVAKIFAFYQNPAIFL